MLYQLSYFRIVLFLFCECKGTINFYTAKRFTRKFS